MKFSGGNGILIFSGGSGSIGTDDSRYPLNFFTGGETLRMITGAENGNVGIATANPKTKLEIEGSVSVGYNVVIPDEYRYVLVRDKVGIGTSNPQSKLDVAGTVRMTGFNLPTNAVDGYVLTSNSTGTASWIDPTLSYFWQKNANGDLYYSDQGHKVGINTNNPSYILDVEGNIGVKDNLTGKSSSTYDALYLIGSELSSSAKIEIGRGANKKGIKLICPDPAGDIQMHFDGTSAVIIQSDAANFGSPTHGMDMNVNGKIEATEVEIMVDIWQDQVFENNYPLMDLNLLERFINENHHLPEIPSEEEVISNGINVGEMNALLLKKIEELTLYVIDLKKENDEMKHRMNVLTKEVAP